MQLDSKLDQIQLALLGGSLPGVEGELIRIRRCPRSRPSGGTSAIFITSTKPASCRHGRRRRTGLQPAPQTAAQIRDAAVDYRDESQRPSDRSRRTSPFKRQFINILTVISVDSCRCRSLLATAMNFGVITMDLNKVWLYGRALRARPAVSMTA